MRWLLLSLCVVASLSTSLARADDGQTVPSDQEMTAMLTTYCVGCHSGDHARGHVYLDTLDGAKDAAVKAASEMTDNKMPTSRAQRQPTADERALMIAWFLAVSPEN